MFRRLKRYQNQQTLTNRPQFSQFLFNFYCRQLLNWISIGNWTTAQLSFPLFHFHSHFSSGSIPQRSGRLPQSKYPTVNPQIKCNQFKFHTSIFIRNLFCILQLQCGWIRRRQSQSPGEPKTQRPGISARLEKPNVQKIAFNFQEN